MIRDPDSVSCQEEAYGKLSLAVTQPTALDV